MENETYYIKIKGKANIPNRLDIGHNYRLTADCSVTSDTVSDNDDGTLNRTATLEVITAEIQKDNGETVKAKDPRKNSVKFRKSAYMVALNHQIDDEKFYDWATIKCIGLLDSLAEEYKKNGY